MIQVVVVDVARHIVAVEHRGVETLDLRVAVAHGLDEIVQILIDQAVGADGFGHLLVGAAVRDQFLARRHVDAVDIGIADRGRRRGEIDLAGTGVPRHLDDLLRGGAAHDGVIDEQDVLAPKFQIDGVELLAHGLPALLLSRHDEGAPDVAVLDEALSVLEVEVHGQLERGRSRGVGNGNDHVDVVVRPDAADLLGQLLAHTQAGLVDGDIVDDGIGPRQIDVLEYAG